MPIQSTNPATGEIEKRFEELDDQQVVDVLDQVAEAYLSWKTTSFAHRRECLRSLARVFRDGAGEYARLMAVEMGKPLSFGRAEAEKCAMICEYYADKGEDMLAPLPATEREGEGYVEFAPLGTVLAIMPWNFPFWQVLRVAAPTLLAGDTMVLKHSSNVPQCALAIEDAFKKSDFPDDVFRTLLIGASKVETVLDHDSVIGVSLTGSEAAGRKVAAAAGARLKKAVMELGGSDPLVVLEDADVEEAASVGALSRCVNAGQACIASKRFIIHQDVYDRFVAALEREMAKLRVGDPMDEDTVIGPMASQELRADLADQVRRCLDAGGHVVCGGVVPEGKGCWYPPTIITDVPWTADVAREELFGPVALVFSARDEEEALTMANGTRFGLGGSVWTRDKDRGLAFARRIESGIVYVNGRVRSHPTMPFGGIGHSGYGRELGGFGIREFVNIKTVCVG